MPRIKRGGGWISLLFPIELTPPTEWPPEEHITITDEEWKKRRRKRKQDQAWGAFGSLVGLCLVAGIYAGGHAIGLW